MSLCPGDSARCGRPLAPQDEPARALSPGGRSGSPGVREIRAGVPNEDDVVYIHHPMQLSEVRSSRRPSVGDMVVILETLNTRRIFPQGVGRKFVISQDCGSSRVGTPRTWSRPSMDYTPPYQFEGQNVALYEDDVQLTDHFVKEANKVVVKDRISQEGRISLVEGLKGEVVKKDDHGAVIKFDESGVQWEHGVSKDHYARLRADSNAVPLPYFEPGHSVIVKGQIQIEGHVKLVEGLQGYVKYSDEHGAMVRFTESGTGTTWDHYVRKEYFDSLEEVEMPVGPYGQQGRSSPIRMLPLGTAMRVA